MLRFYFIIVIYIGLVISSILLINEFSQLLIIIITSTIIFISAIVWGVSNIQSQMFLKSCNSNPNAIDKIAITYDDGPDKENTPKILEVLKKYDAKASFFLIGENIVEHKNLAESIHNDGHYIGNHSYHHKNSFPFQSRKRIGDEINKTQIEIEKITGKQKHYFRPPFGVTNPTVSRALLNFNLQVVGWNIRSFDTKKSIEKEKTLKRVISKIKTGDIILLHDKTEHICWLTEEVLLYLQKNNLRAVTIDELINN